MVTLDEEWVAGLVAASAGLDDAEVASADAPAVVEISIGKSDRVALVIEQGRVVGSAEDSAVPDVEVPTSGEQLAGFCDGSESMARSYMQGDVKPVGSTGALLSLIALFENHRFRRALADR